MRSLGPGTGPGAGKRGAGARPLALLAFLLLLAGCAAAPAPGSGESARSTAADPLRLAGLSAAELKRVLGEPDFAREEPPAAVWQYRGGDCVLDVFLYGESGLYRVAYAETRDRGIIRVAQSSCYASLLSRHGAEAKHKS